VSGPGVLVTRRPVWRMRLGERVVRVAICAAALVGCAATARDAIAPPRPRLVAAAPQPAADLAEEGLATLFVRRYLTWTASDPQAQTAGLAQFAGFIAPSSGAQAVMWAEVVQVSGGVGGSRVYTVAADTDADGVVYLTVPLVRRSGGAIALAGYPAFVGPPAEAPFTALSDGLPDVTDGSLEVVVTRALRNYLSGASSDLAADLTPGASVAVPTVALTLQDVTSLRWSSGGSVLAEVIADDSHGGQYTLDYELDVVRAGPRWEISAIQTDPDA